MPWTLYRSIVAELLKVLVLACAALVGVLAFAVAIKPLSEGTLGPGKLLVFSLMMSPWLLRIALPFAAAFAGVVVFLRLAADREILACLAAGISLRRILAPVAALGLVLAVGHMVISHRVVPGFYRSAKAMLQRDLIEAVVGRVEAGRAVTFENWVLYADRAAAEADPEPVAGSDVPPEQLVTLEGMALGRLGQGGGLRHVATCRRAELLLYRVRGRRWATMRLSDALRWDRESGQLEEVASMAIPPVRLPAPLEHDPEFLSGPGLARLRARPTRGEGVASARRAVVRAVTAERVAGALRRRIRAGEAVRLAAGADTSYRIEAAAAERTDGGLRLAGPVRVRQLRRGVVTRRMRAGQARIELGALGPEGVPRVRVRLEGVAVTDLRSNLETERRRLRLATARPQGVGPGKIAELGARALVDRARDAAWGRRAAVERAVARLARAIDELEHEIAAVIEERRALAVASGLALVLGAVAGIRFREGTALGVYFRVFLLAVGGVVVIFCGERFAPRIAMILVTWSGPALLAAASGWVLWRWGRGA